MFEENSALGRSIFQSFPGDDEVRLPSIRLEYPPVLAAQGVIRKNIQSIGVLKTDRKTSRRADLNLLHHELSRFAEKEFRDAFIPPVAALHVPIEIVRTIITFLRRIIKVAAGDHNLISMPDAPRTLNVESVFAHFFFVAATVLNRLARAKLKPFQISRAT